MTERERELEQEVARLKRQMEFLQPIVDAYVGCKGQKQAKDRVLRAEVVATVRTAIMDVLEGDDEVWLSSEDFVKNFGMFTPEWLRKNGYMLPRERVIMVMEDGTEKEMRRWAYPKHRINRMIREGKLKSLASNKESNGR